MKIFKRLIVCLMLLPGMALALTVGQTIELGPIQTLNSVPYAIPANNTKNTLIQVWATWCPFCKKQNAYLEKLYKELPPNSLNVITI